MRKTLILILFMIFSGVLPAAAGNLIIRGGATLTLKNATLNLNCSSLFVQSGGRFDLGTGTVLKCGNLLSEPGATVLNQTGMILFCQDSDDDGLADDLEVSLGTDPNNPDSDGDGLPDGEEDANYNGIRDPNETDAMNPDSDGDGMNDGTEVLNGRNPLINEPAGIIPIITILLSD